MLRLLLPVIQEDVLPELRKIGIRLDARPVVRLREQLDHAGEREHRPRRLAKDDRGHLVRLWQELISRRHARRDHRLDAPEQLLVLELLVGEPDERLQRNLVAEPVVAAHLQDLGADEAFDETEHVGVGPPLNLRQNSPLRGGQDREGTRVRQTVGQELLRKSNWRPRITSRSMSQRTRLETSTAFA